MFRRLVTNNIKTIGIRKYSGSNNDEIVKHLEKINFSLNMILLQVSTITILIGISK